MNETIEQCFLGCLLRSPAIWKESKFLIRKEHFNLAPSIKLFDIFQKWAEQTDNYETKDQNDFLIFVESEYKDWIKINKKYIKDILNLIIDKDQANEKWSYYIKNLELLFFNKKSLDILATLHKKIETNPTLTSSIIREGVSDLNLMYNYINSGKDDTTLTELTIDKLSDIHNRLNNSFKPSLSGINGLDTITEGYYPGTYNLIAARSSMGKSALMGTMVRDMVNNQSKKIAVFNLETSNKVFMDRWAAQELKINGKLLKNPLNLSQEERNIYINFIENFDKTFNNKLFLYDDIYHQDKIFEKIINLYNTVGLDGVFIDMIGYVKKRDMAYQNRQLELADISNEFFKFVKAYPNLFITILQQMNKQGDNANTDSNSGQGSIREAEDTYLQADNVIYIYPFRNEDKKSDKNSRIITVDKNRHGDVGSAHIQYVKEYLLFSDQIIGGAEDLLT